MSTHPTQIKTAPAIRATQLPTVLTLLMLLVFACLLPALIGAGVLFYREYQDGRAQLQKNTLQTARAIVQTVDAQMNEVRVVAQTLATSDSLARQDFAAFHRRARTLLHASDIGQSLVIYDVHGQQLVNTRIPFGQPLPKRSNPVQVERVFATGKQVTSEVLLSPFTGLPMISIAVPVFSGVKVVFALAIHISPQQFNNILLQQHLPPQWMVSVFDSTGTIAGRTHSPEKLVGQKGVPALLRYIAQAPEGMHDITTLEGIPSLVAYSRSPVSGWSVAIGISRQSLEAPLLHTLALLGWGGVLLLSVSIGLAWFVGRRITSSVRAVVASAIAMGTGELGVMPQVYLREADDVAQAMASAARLLKERRRSLEVAHDALVAHDAELAFAQRIAKIGSWQWDARTDITVASSELCRIFGREKFPLLAQQCDVLFPQEAWQELNQAMKEVVRTGIGYNLELPALHAQGNRLWVNARSEVVCNAVGEVIGLRGMMQDISERKQAEEIAKSARFVRAITDAMPGMVGYWDKDLRCRFANKTYMTWFGKAPEEIIGGTMKALKGETLFSLNESYVLAALAGEPQQFERAMTKADGSIGYVMANYIPDIDGHGTVAGFHVLVTDVTLFKKAEAELKLAELATLDARKLELQIGFNIQQALLMADVPSELNGAWISSYVEPSQGLHGDFIAVARHSPTRFCLLVGDVMGKGINAAMIGAGIKNTFYQVLAELLAQAIDTRLLPDAATIINALHRKVTPQLINMDCFVTLALYLFDADAGTVAVVNAGHTEALLVRASAASVESVVGENLPLGVLASELYVQHVLPVADDDHLVMYSDGISEVSNEHGEEFGSTGIAAWLLSSCQANLSGDLALQQLRQQLAQFRASVRMVDDQTVVMIRLRAVREMATL
jgi:PAS domain S-box-containing protein